jgi:hypothetical protein
VFYKNVERYEEREKIKKMKSIESRLSFVIYNMQTMKKTDMSSIEFWNLLQYNITNNPIPILRIHIRKVWIPNTNYKNGLVHDHDICKTTMMYDESTKTIFEIVFYHEHIQSELITFLEGLYQHHIRICNVNDLTTILHEKIDGMYTTMDKPFVFGKEEIEKKPHIVLTYDKKDSDWIQKTEMCLNQKKQFMNVYLTM